MYQNHSQWLDHMILSSDYSIILLYLYYPLFMMNMVPFIISSDYSIILSYLYLFFHTFIILYYISYFTHIVSPCFCSSRSRVRRRQEARSSSTSFSLNAARRSHGETMEISWGIPGLVNIQKASENHHRNSGFLWICPWQMVMFTLFYGGLAINTS